ncbi:mixed lineage kinase domain-like protein isoform X2 [Xyrichtys novacula]|uniref:Mixed lineage kinase domain-like protein isoform X2 n=1 Tax=Xyrichtys novacula TaxID=13765 RepID=A0AAV1F3L8_XYRNO|nr:mixed lineage kinase domain-like protein isoform X2 [Xyrichtys novacula]
MDLQPAFKLIPGLSSSYSFFRGMAISMRANNERFQELAQRVTFLEDFVLKIQANGLDRKSHSVKNALEDLSRTLENTRRWMRKYSKFSRMKKVLKCAKYADRINYFERKLSDCFMFLSGNVMSTLGNEMV